MKFSSDTINVLKNFASINQNIMFKEGHVVQTISPQRNILAKATVSEDFPSDFGIYDLNQFLNAVGLFRDPDIEVMSENLTMKEDKSRLNYTFADPSMIQVPPEKELTFPEPEIDFVMTKEQLSKVLKAAAVLGLPEVLVVGNGESVTLEADNSSSSTADSFREEVGETTKKFSMVFKIDHLNLVRGDYDVKISSKGISHWQNRDLELDYFIATETTSTYEG